MNSEFFCPSCGEETDHEILKEGSDLLVRCNICGNVRHEEKPKMPKELTIKTIVSGEGESQKGLVEMFEDEIVEIGDIIVAEVGDEPVGVEVTGIESGSRRLTKAKASDIETLWTRIVEKVVVRASVHAGWKTIPIYIETDGERDFAVDEVCNEEGLRFRITHIKLRSGSVMRKEGWKAYARKIKRIYGTKV
ncbi:HVO_0476 family zinc finger protein [Methanolacinia petrolearia]|uniref:HVO_0476 family zinc finger protein n=1 Tax=Methanolacinia petrolearia TaxID=54120 RepID=UPI003BA98D81